MNEKAAFAVGLLLGLVLPIIFGTLFALISPGGDSLASHFRYLFSSPAIVVRFGFVALLPDLFGVFILNHLEKWFMCRGMFVAIMLFIIALLIYTI